MDTIFLTHTSLYHCEDLHNALPSAWQLTSQAQPEHKVHSNLNPKTKS